MNYDMKTKYKGCFKMIDVVLRYRYTPMCLEHMCILALC